MAAMTTALRVVHVVIDDHGGSVEYAQRLCVASERMGVSSRAAILPLQPVAATGLRSAAAWSDVGVPIVQLPAVLGPLGIVRAIRALRPLVRQADVVVTHTGAAGLIGRIAGLLAGRPVVHVAHNWPGAAPAGGTRARMLGLLDRFLAPYTAAVIAPSNAMRREGIAHGWARPGRCGVIRYALDRARHAAQCDADRAAARATLGLPLTAPVIAFCGRFDPVKGASAFIAAAHALAARHPGLIALMAGDGPDAAAVASAASASNCVRLLGWRSDVPRIYQAADVACVPSTSEALGIVVLEAFAAGTPVVATRVGGLPEAVGTGGVLVAAGDSAALITALDELLRDPARRARLAERGRRWIDRLHGGDAWAEAHRRLWQRLAARS